MRAREARGVDDGCIGQVVDAIEALGALDDTLIWVIAGDNGASGEGTLHVEAGSSLPPGSHRVRMDFEYDGGGVAKGGTVRLFIDDREVGQGRRRRSSRSRGDGGGACRAATAPSSRGRELASNDHAPDR